MGLRVFLWYSSIWKKHELSWSIRCFVYIILSIKMFPLCVDTWCHIDETLGWVIEFFLFVHIFMIYWNSWRGIQFKVQREETEKQETREVNKSQGEDLCQPLWGHSLMEAQAGGVFEWRKRHYFLMTPTPPCPSVWLRECIRCQPPFFPRWEAFVQWINPTMVHGGPGKSWKWVGGMCSSKVGVVMKREG